MAEPEAATMGQTEEHPPAVQARRLLRAARGATLATATAGQPFASLVTPACDIDLSVLILISTLSDHTRHLQSEPRCALMVAAAPTSANPQTAPRVTITGLAAPEPDPEMKKRWLRIHPYAAFYADFGDFSLWRIRPMGAQLVGGFARAARIKQADLLPDPAAVIALREAEPGIIEHCNTDHPDAMDAIARTAGGSGTGWRIVVADTDGCDLVRDEVVLRAHWSASAANGDDVRRETILLTRAGRGAQPA
jgi:putative heme iron utilization protein